MPIDFSKLTAPKEVIVPILNNTFQYHKKKYKLSTPIEDGWWVVAIEGNKSTPKKPYFCLEVDKRSKHIVYGFTYHNQIIFQNQDVVRRKFNLGHSAPLHFNQVDTFTSMKAIAWEDGNLYFTEVNYADLLIYEVKNAFDNGISLEGTKGVTPELRTLYLFHDLERQHLLEIKKMEDDKRHERELMQSIPGRLTLTLKRSGAELISWSVSGNRIVFAWKLLTGEHQYNSVIDSNTWMMLECGYCMNNDDKRHNITSMVKTAELYEEDDAIFITRR
jgi:hypothetical protein